MTTRRKITDYARKQSVALTKQVWSVMLVLEETPVVLENADVQELYFIEDIFKFSMVGKITFLDRFNLLELGPFTGNEQISLIYSIGDQVREIVFDIWKIGKISQAGPGMRESSENYMEIYFVDPLFAGLSTRKYSRSWSDEKYSVIMKNILDKLASYETTELPFIVEESSNKTDFIIPYWNPITAMRWLMRRAKGKTSDTSGYLCYNSSRDLFTHNLVSMNYLLADEDNTLDRKTYIFNAKNASEENKILEWWINSLDRNTIPRIRGGKWRGYDFQKKTLRNRKFLYSDGVDKTVMLGRQTLYPKIDDALSSNIMAGDSSNNALDNIALADWGKRYNLQFIVNLIVEGNEKRYAGSQIEIEWASQGTGITPSTTSFNDMLKGKYLIKSVTHIFSPGRTYPYRQRLVCIKNGYHNTRSEQLLKSTKYNTDSEKYAEVKILRGR